MDQNLTAETIFTAPSQDDPVQPEALMLGMPNHQGEASNVMKFPDGSAVVGAGLDESSQFRSQMNSDHHNENLALVLSESELRDIGNSLKHAIEEDIESQEDFFEAVAKIIEYLGLTLTSESDEEDLPFKGASSVYSTAMFESALDLVASAKGGDISLNRNG